MTGPDYIQFYPTLRCNRTCDFCFNRRVPAMPDMSLSSFVLMLDAFEGTGIRTLDIIGGEPTLHPDITTFVLEAGARGYFINLSSNGTNLDVLARIMNLGKHITVGISVNDRPTFEHVHGFIREHKPVVKTVFTPEPDRALIEQILASGPEKFYFIYRDVTKDDLHAGVPFHRFKAEVERTFGQEAGTVYCGGFLPDVHEYPELAGVRCPAGTTKLGVMPDGSVYPCNLFFGTKEFLLGNILHDSFTDIWNHGRLAFFRTFRSNNCSDRSCEFHAECHGGCPAQSACTTGGLSARDPRCSLA